MMRFRFPLVICALAFAACSNEPTKKLDSCVPGEVDECPCGGGVDSTQVCLDDGTFGGCACGDAGAWDLGEPQDVSIQPDVARPDYGRPDYGRPDYGQPDDGHPDFGHPDFGQPDFGRPDMGGPSGGDCSSNPPPPRCSQDPTNFAWEAASIIDDIFVEGTENEPICCFDYNGDGEIDNTLGVNLAGFGFLADVNLSLDASVASGAIALVLEHQGLAGLSGSYVLNWWQARWGAGMMQIGPSQNPVLLSAVSIDQGAQPRTYFHDATLSQGVLTAGRGRIEISLNLFDVDLFVTVRRARLRANLVAMNSGVPNPGIDLTSGELGGVITVEDMLVAVNAAASGCACLGVAGPLVDVQNGQCNPNADAQACANVGNVTCEELANSCNLWGAIGLFADVDLDGDGLNDASSIGLSFTARPAQIQGIAP